MTKSHRTDARTILATAILATHRPLLAWAVGAPSPAVTPLWALTLLAQGRLTLLIRPWGRGSG